MLNFRSPRQPILSPTPKKQGYKKAFDRALDGMETCGTYPVLDDADLIMVNVTEMSAYSMTCEHK